MRLIRVEYGRYCICLRRIGLIRVAVGSRLYIRGVRIRIAVGLRLYIGGVLIRVGES